MLDRQSAQDLDSALFEAVSDNKIKAAKLLLDNGASPNGHRSSLDGNTCLHVAIDQQSPEMIEMLVESGADLAMKNNAKQTPMHFACVNKYYAAVSQIATLRNTDYRDAAEYSRALMYAVRSSNFDTAFALLCAGASPNKYGESDTLNTCLHVAVLENFPEMAVLLLSFDAQPKRKNCDGFTPVEVAAKLHHWKCLKAISTFNVNLTGSSIYFRLSNNISDGYDELYAGNYCKEAVFARILRLELKDRVQILEKCLVPNSDTRFEQFFKLSRGGLFSLAPSIHRGVLKRIHDEYLRAKMEYSISTIVINVDSTRDIMNWVRQTVQLGLKQDLTSATVMTGASSQSQADEQCVFVPVLTSPPISQLEASASYPVSAATESAVDNKLVPIYLDSNQLALFNARQFHSQSADVTMTAQLAQLPSVNDLPPLPVKEGQRRRLLISGASVEQ